MKFVMMMIGLFGLSNMALAADLKCPKDTTKVVECAKPNPTGKEFVSAVIVCKDGNDYGMAMKGGNDVSPFTAAEATMRIGATTYTVDDGLISLTVSVSPKPAGTLNVSVSDGNGKDKKVPVKMDCKR
jgi:hypothetical protein